MTLLASRKTTPLACASLMALVAGCIPADKGPSCELGERPHGKQMTFNRLGSEVLMFNALTTNPSASQKLIENPLSSDTYDGANPGADAELVEQLADPWAQQVMSYLVECALKPGQTVTWRDPADPQGAITWEGRHGMCPAWHDPSIQARWPGGTIDSACQELVTACLLARNNVFEQRVPISVRGVRDSSAIPLAPTVAGDEPASADSFQACGAGATGLGTAQQDCGWSAEHVGMCQPGTGVELQVDTATCTSGTMTRVCDGASGCDSDDAAVLAAHDDVCSASALPFTCGATGAFTVMTASSASVSGAPAPPSAVKQVSAGLYPVAEARFFHWLEGAFYGDMFGADAVSPRLWVRVDDGEVIYLYDDVPTRIFDTAARGEGAGALRRSAHQCFMDELIPTLRKDLIVYEDAYSCWSPGWTEGRAYAKSRVCAGPAGQGVCAAGAVGPCWQARGASDNLCALDDSQAQAGDRDFDDCQDDQHRTWRHPLTVFLDDPCAIVPSACSIKRPESIVAYGHHACVALDTGAMRCWGDNARGHLGYPPAAWPQSAFVGDDETPATVGDVSGLGPVVQVATGAQHTCALYDTGAADNVVCWGEGSAGQLGNASTAPVVDPANAVAVSIGGVAVAITAGAFHTCALLDTGDVVCWGANGAGQLGHGHTNTIGDDEAPAAAGAVTLGGAATQITAGASHTCALMDTGDVVCWGANSAGQLGYGHTDPVGDDEEPVLAGAVELDGAQVAHIAAGGEHTCALIVSTTASEVMCWGANGAGQLGYGHTDAIGDDELPAAAGPVDVGGPVAHIAAGAAHTCAILLATGAVRCWGANELGQLGYGHTVVVGDGLDPVPGLGTQVPSAAGDVIIGGPARGIAAGQRHTCALLERGYVRCWGYNESGQLGHGSLAITAFGDEAGELPIGSHVRLY